jgi:hypothetical protein
MIAGGTFMQGCLMGGAGSIIGYDYPANKYELEKTIKEVLKSDRDVYRDSNRNYMIDITNNKHDTIDNNYYNDGENYMTIKIKVINGECEYIFRFYGDEQNWKASDSSEIFIVYAYDEKGNGGSEGYGINKDIKKKLTDVFESEFVDKVDKKLGSTHTTLSQ